MSASASVVVLFASPSVASTSEGAGAAQRGSPRGEQHKAVLIQPGTGGFQGKQGIASLVPSKGAGGRNLRARVMQELLPRELPLYLARCGGIFAAGP